MIAVAKRWIGSVTVLAIAWAAPGADASPPSAPAYRTFGDWTVACDNAGDCEARGFTDDDSGLAMRFTRRAGAASVPSLTLHGVGPRATLGFDGRAWPLPAGSSGSRVAGEMPEATVHGLDAVRDFAAMAHRAKLVRAGNSEGSLAGFDAAMLFVDDVQGRIDTPTAIARAGRSHVAVPAARALPVVRARPLRGPALDAASVRRYVAALPMAALDCDDPEDMDDAAVLPLGARDVIAMRPCNRGAYQTAYAVFRGPRDDPRHARPLQLRWPPGVDGEAGLLTEATIDAATGRLAMFARGRGLADCGESGEWVFDGRDFVPVAYARLDRCGWISPGDYPVLWRARVVGADAP